MTISRVVVLSAHFDDAVLSCWSILNRYGSDALVLTVFGGSPPPGQLWPWDAIAPGAADSASRVRERMEENRQALAPTNSNHVDLDFLDGQYIVPGARQPRAADLMPLLRDAELVFCPAAQGRVNRHPDHLRVRALVMQVRPDASLYADQPYFQFPADLDALPVEKGYAYEVVRLKKDEAKRKANAIACYTGEVARMGNLGSRLDHPADEFLFEVLWQPVGS
jgi:LmbE family N-acetylglucosaminyl deacetylase